MRSLFALVLTFATSVHPYLQMPMGGVTVSPAGCSPPTMTSRWAAYNTSNTCTASAVPCTNGALGWNLPDFNSVNAASNTASTGPTYTTGAINGLPAWTFNSASSQFWRLTSGITQSGSITFYAVFKTPASSHQGALFGVQVGHGMEYRITSANKQDAVNQGLLDLGNGTTTLTSSTWYTSVMTYNYSTGALALYLCSAGTCSADGTATATSTFSAATNDLGAAQDVGDYFNGLIAEWGYLNSANTTGIAAWSQCKYGI